MRSFVTALALATVVSLPLSASLIRYADWADGPVHHLMTKQEIAEWKTIDSDERAKAFVDLFWARRDPTPDTPRNEFREEFEARVALADKQFTSARIRGAMSDPGRVLILLGTPWQVAMKGGSAAITSRATPAAGSAPVDADGSLSVPRPVADPPRQVWTYAHDHKPKFIPQPDFVLVFDDEGQNEWQLAHTDRINPDILLAEAVKAILVSPNLTKPPFATDTAPNRAAFSSPDLRVAFEEFRADGKRPVGPATLTWGEFVTPEGEDYIASQLYVPSGSGIAAGQDVTLFSVIENDKGEIVDVHEEPAKVIASGNDAYVDESIRIQPGHYNATFGIAAGNKILSARSTELNIDDLEGTKSGVSPLILSNNITPLQTTWHPDDPFTFGGLKVVPKGDATFPQKGDLWYFVELRNPGLDEQKNPAIQVKVEISGTTAKGPAHMTLPMTAAGISPLKGAKNRYALGLAIPLESLQPGDYTIKVHLVDTVLSKTYDLEKAFKINRT